MTYNTSTLMTLCSPDSRSPRFAENQLAARLLMVRSPPPPHTQHFRTEKQLTAPADRPVRESAHAVAFTTAVVIRGAGSVHRRTGMRTARALAGDRSRANTRVAPRSGRFGSAAGGRACSPGNAGEWARLVLQPPEAPGPAVSSNCHVTLRAPGTVNRRPRASATALLGPQSAITPGVAGPQNNPPARPVHADRRRPASDRYAYRRCR